MGCGSVVAGKIPLPGFSTFCLRAGGWVQRRGLSCAGKGHPHRPPGLARGRARALVRCGSPTITLSPSTLLGIPDLRASPNWRMVRDPRGFSPSPLPPSLFPRWRLIRFPSPQTAPHSLTINKWTWPEASAAVCMLNLLLPLPASRIPGTREPCRRCQHPAFGAPPESCQIAAALVPIHGERGEGAAHKERFIARPGT